jgi:hypothetical protein
MTHSCTTIYPKARIEILQFFEKMLGYVHRFVLLQDCTFTFLEETFGDLKCGIYHLFKKSFDYFFLDQLFSCWYMSIGPIMFALLVCFV